MTSESSGSADKKMRLEDQVANLKLSKRLKELGVKQESYLYWHTYPGQGPGLHTKNWPQKYGDPIYSAFTVAELGEMTKGWCSTYWDDGEMSEIEGGAWVSFVEIIADGGPIKIDAAEKTEADCRAQVLIQLIENKLVSL